MNDPYSVLGITPGADEETIKKAYRQKCKQYHPDLHPDDPTCEDKFKDVQAAYSEVMRVAMVAMLPLLSIQAVGFIYEFKAKHTSAVETYGDFDIIELWEETGA